MIGNRYIYMYIYVYMYMYTHTRTHLIGARRHNDTRQTKTTTTKNLFCYQNSRSFCTVCHLGLISSTVRTINEVVELGSGRLKRSMGLSGGHRGFWTTPGLVFGWKVEAPKALEKTRLLQTWAPAGSEGPTTQCLRTLVPKNHTVMGFAPETSNIGYLVSLGALNRNCHASSLPSLILKLRVSPGLSSLKGTAVL